jgi:cell division protein FtsB
MITARAATVVLVLLLVLVHLGLWFGKGSVPHVWSQRAQLASPTKCSCR